MTAINKQVDRSVPSCNRVQTYLSTDYGSGIVNTESGATISYTAPDTITDTASGFIGFAPGDLISISGSTSNDGIYAIDTAAVGSITTVEQTIATEASSSASIITKLVTEATFNFDADLGRSAKTGYVINNDQVNSITLYFNHTDDTFSSMGPVILTAADKFSWVPGEFCVKTLKITSTSIVDVNVFVA